MQKPTFLILTILILSSCKSKDPSFLYQVIGVDSLDCAPPGDESIEKHKGFSKLKAFITAQGSDSTYQFTGVLYSTKQNKNVLALTPFLGHGHLELADEARKYIKSKNHLDIKETRLSPIVPNRQSIFYSSKKPNNSGTFIPSWAGELAITKDSLGCPYGYASKANKTSGYFYGNPTVLEPDQKNDSNLRQTLLKMRYANNKFKIQDFDIANQHLAPIFKQFGPINFRHQDEVVGDNAIINFFIEFYSIILGYDFPTDKKFPEIIAKADTIENSLAPKQTQVKTDFTMDFADFSAIDKKKAKILDFLQTISGERNSPLTKLFSQVFYSKEIIKVIEPNLLSIKRLNQISQCKSSLERIQQNYIFKDLVDTNKCLVDLYWILSAGRGIAQQSIAEIANPDHKNVMNDAYKNLFADKTGLKDTIRDFIFGSLMSTFSGWDTEISEPNWKTLTSNIPLNSPDFQLFISGGFHFSLNLVKQQINAFMNFFGPERALIKKQKLFAPNSDTRKNILEKLDASDKRIDALIDSYDDELKEFLKTPKDESSRELKSLFKNFRIDVQKYKEGIFETRIEDVLHLMYFQDAIEKVTLNPSKKAQPPSLKNYFEFAKQFADFFDEKGLYLKGRLTEHLPIFIIEVDMK